MNDNTLPNRLWHDDESKDGVLVVTNRKKKVWDYIDHLPSTERSFPVHKVVLAASSCPVLKKLASSDSPSSSPVLETDVQNSPKHRLHLKTKESFSDEMIDVFVHFLYFDKIEKSEGCDPKPSTVARLVLIGTEICYPYFVHKCRKWFLPFDPLIKAILFSAMALAEVDPTAEGRDLDQILRELCGENPSLAVMALTECDTVGQVEVFARMDLGGVKQFLPTLVGKLRRLKIDPVKYILEKRLTFEYQDILQCLESKVLESDQAIRLFEFKKYDGEDVICLCSDEDHEDHSRGKTVKSNKGPATPNESDGSTLSIPETLKEDTASSSAVRGKIDIPLPHSSLSVVSNPKPVPNVDNVVTRPAHSLSSPLQPPSSIDEPLSFGCSDSSITGSESETPSLLRPIGSASPGRKESSSTLCDSNSGFSLSRDESCPSVGRVNVSAPLQENGSSAREGCGFVASSSRSIPTLDSASGSLGKGKPCTSAGCLDSSASSEARQSRHSLFSCNDSSSASCSSQASSPDRFMVPLSPVADGRKVPKRRSSVISILDNSFADDVFVADPSAKPPFSLSCSSTKGKLKFPINKADAMKRVKHEDGSLGLKFVPPSPSDCLSLVGSDSMNPAQKLGTYSPSVSWGDVPSNVSTQSVQRREAHPCSSIPNNTGVKDRQVNS